MADTLRQEVEFLLFDWLKTDSLVQYPEFSGQDRSDWAAYLDLAGAVSWNEFHPCYKSADRDEPRLIDGRVHVQPDMKRALRTYLEAGLHLATVDADQGGMGFPFVIASAAMAEFMAANVAASGFIMLSIANARVIVDHGTPAQIDTFARPQFDGTALGTMCLSEPDIGSALGDITTRAVPDGDDEFGPRYRLSGRKMWISGGDQDVTDNVIHLVLAKVVQPDGKTVPGPKGTTLFIVPKTLPDSMGTDARNDVAVAGLNHKMGYRGIPNCLLNFGENEGAIGWRIGAEGDGLRIMFQMMNEARTNVGLSGAALAYRGYSLSRRYAAERIQGRPAYDKAAEKPVPILAHPDVRRMLLLQKVIAEGALALCLKSALLCDLAGMPDSEDHRNASALLDLLTPVIKSWPSEQGHVALYHAIQTHGGYGYTRDFDLEQLYRDNRLNPIHEGTTGIQAIDLVGRKLLGDGGAGFRIFLKEVRATAAASTVLPAQTAALISLCDLFETLTDDLNASGDVAHALSNATSFLDGFGHFVVAWIWLDIANAAARSGDNGLAEEKAWACRFFFAAEVPKIPGMLALFRDGTSLTRDVPDTVFS